MYGDSTLRVNLSNLQNKFINSSKKAVMTVIKNKNKWDKSNVYFEDKATIIYNKSKVSKKFDYIDYGILAIKSEIFNKYPENKSFDLSSVLKNISIKKQLEGYKVLKRFYHIGDERNIKETSNFLRRKKMNFIKSFLNESKFIIENIDKKKVDSLISEIYYLKKEKVDYFFRCRW